MTLQYRDKVTGKVKYLDESKDPNIIIENLNQQLTQANADFNLLQQDNAQLWYDSMLKDIKIEQSETEIAQLWYEIMMGSVA